MRLGGDPAVCHGVFDYLPLYLKVPQCYGTIATFYKEDIEQLF